MKTGKMLQKLMSKWPCNNVINSFRCSSRKTASSLSPALCVMQESYSAFHKLKVKGKKQKFQFSHTQTGSNNDRPGSRGSKRYKKNTKWVLHDTF
ncbi:hypothetical protein FKM82_005979 [Ascaphus truei]